jgi:hypothetical protein
MRERHTRRFRHGAESRPIICISNCLGNVKTTALAKLALKSSEFALFFTSELYIHIYPGVEPILECSGTKLTNREAAQVFSRVPGKPVRFQKLHTLLVRLVLGRVFYQMFRWFNNTGFRANIPELRRKYPEVHLQTLEEWLRNEGWHKRARRVRLPKR